MRAKKQKRASGLLSLIATAILFGLLPLVVRNIGDNIPLFYSYWTRAFVFGFIFHMFWRRTGGRFIKIRQHDWKWLIMRSIGGFISFFGIYLSLLHVDVGTTYFVYFAGFVLSSYLLGIFVFGEKLKKIMIASLVFAFMGLWLTQSATLQTSSLMYTSYSLIGGLGYAIWTSFNKKVVDHYDANQLNIVDFYLAGLFALIVSLIFKEAWLVPALTAPWMWSSIMGVIWVLTGIFIIYGFTHVDVALGSLILLFEIPCALLIGLTLYHEKLTEPALLGGTLIITAIAMPEIADYMSRKKR
jgi:drug/metabolite transporter (DMT)-like permease